MDKISNHATPEEATIPGANKPDGAGNLAGSDDVTQLEAHIDKLCGPESELLTTAELGELPGLPAAPSPPPAPLRTPMRAESVSGGLDEDTIVGLDITNARTQPPPPEA